MIKVEREYVESCETAHIERVLREVDADPASARQLQGTMVLVFPEHEEEEQLIWLDPEVRAWVRQAHERIPHLAYYLAPEPGMGALFFMASALAGPPGLPVSRDGEEVCVKVSDDLAVSIARRLTAGAIFAESIADDWRPFVREMVAPLDEAVGQRIFAVVRSGVAGEPI